MLFSIPYITLHRMLSAFLNTHYLVCCFSMYEFSMHSVFQTEEAMLYSGFTASEYIWNPQCRQILTHNHKHAFISLIYHHIPQRYPQRGCYSVIIKPLHIHTHIWCSIPGHKSINAPPLFIHWEIWRNPFIIALYTSKDYVHWDQHCTQFITGSFNEATHTHTHTHTLL